MAHVVESVATNSTDNSTTCVIAKPTGLAVGNLMVASLVCQALTASAITTLSGWTSAVSQTSSRAGGVSIQFKVATSDDVAESDFTFTAAVAGGFSGAIIRLSNNRTSSIVGVTDGYAANTVDSATLSTTVSITPAFNESFVVMAVTGRSTAFDGTTRTISGYNTTPTITFTELFDYSDIGNNPRQGGSAYGTQTTAAELTQYGAVFSVSRTDHLACLATFYPVTNASGSNALSSTDTITFTQAGIANASGANTLTETDTVGFTQGGRATSPDVWVDQTKTDGTWTDQPK